MQTEFTFPKTTTPVFRKQTVSTRRCRDIRNYLDQLQWQTLEDYKVLEKRKDYYWVELRFSDGYSLTVMMER